MHADDILMVAGNKDKLDGMMYIQGGRLISFGLKLVESRTVTMTWNTPVETRESGTLISVNNTELDTWACTY